MRNIIRNTMKRRREDRQSEEMFFLNPLSIAPLWLSPLSEADHLTMTRINAFTCSAGRPHGHKHSSTCSLVSRGVTCGSPYITSIAVAHMFRFMEGICMEIVIREAGIKFLWSNIFRQEAARYIKALQHALKPDPFGCDVTTIVVEYLTGSNL